DVLAALTTPRPSRTRRPGQAATDNRVLSVEPRRSMMEMHRPAPAAAHACPSPEQLCQKGLDGDALGDRVAVPAMCAGNDVATPQRSTDADGAAFLADRGVKGAGHAAAAMEAFDRCLGCPHQSHPTV